MRPLVVPIFAALLLSSCKPQEMNPKNSRAASAKLSESNLSTEFRAIRDSLLATRTPSDLETIITDLDKRYEKLPPDARFLASQIIGLRAARSLVFRMRPVFENTRTTHSALVTWVKRVAANMRVHLPTADWDAYFRYVTEPSGPEARPFRTVSEVQAHLQDHVYSEMLITASRLRSLEVSDAKPITWDNRVIFGSDSFLDNLDRYRSLGTAERDALLAQIEAASHDLLVLCSYQLDAAPQVAQQLGRLVGFDGFLGDEVNGFSAQDRAGILRGQGTFLTLRPQGPQLMKQALDHLRKSVTLGRSAWESATRRPANAHAPLSADRLVPWQRQSELTLANIEDSLKGPAEVRSAITGEVVGLNIPAFYENPPRDLKVFLPMEFDKSPEFYNLHGHQVRNYFHGRATSWNVAAFKPYLTSLTAPQDVAKAARILGQAWGGAQVLGPLRGVALID